MLVNATQQEELRVALVDGQKLYDLSIDLPSREQKKSNIYKGRIARIEPSLEACFVDYGAERHGFLPLKEVSREYFMKPAQGGRTNMRELLQEGQDIVVQVEKEERGTKGAALTTFISLAGRFLVLMPNNPRAGGVSRRIEGEDRDQMKAVMDALNVPDGMGSIVRTAGVGRAVEELQWDLDNLKAQWDEIVKSVLARPSPFLVYRESDPVTRALRDYLSDDIGEVLIDEQKAFDIAQEYVQRFIPNEQQRRLKFYDDVIPLFTRFQIESQIESAYAHKVQLPSGGSLVIDFTEALVSIDINSARATRGSDIETTATNTNLEAADEIARQLRIRDIGGLIVIDFIDMDEPRNQRAVEDRLRDAVRMDRARIQIGRLSRFGMLEMSRQRLRPSLDDSSHSVCPRCQGIGSIRTVESMALSIIRLIGEEARKDRTSRVIVEVPVDVATYLINEKREYLRTLEDKSDVDLVIVPNLNIHSPEYSIRRVRADEAELPENRRPSHHLPTPAQVADPASTREKTVEQEPAAVPTFLPTTPAPIIVQPPKVEATAVVAPAAPRPGLLTRIKRYFVGDPVPQSAVAAGTATLGEGARDGAHRSERSDRGGRSGRSGRGGRDRDRDRERKPAEAQRAERGDRPKSGGDRARAERDRPRDAEAAPRRESPRGRDRSRSRDGVAANGASSNGSDAAFPAAAAAAAVITEQSDATAPNTAPNTVPNTATNGGELDTAAEGARESSGERRGRRGRRRGRRGGAGAAAAAAAGTPGAPSIDADQPDTFTAQDAEVAPPLRESRPLPSDPAPPSRMSWTGTAAPAAEAPASVTAETAAIETSPAAAPPAEAPPDDRPLVTPDAEPKKVIWSSGPSSAEQSYRRDD